MKYQGIIIVALFSLLLVSYKENKDTRSVLKSDKNRNPRLIDPDPNAWNDLNMNVVISDFQESDGIFSSFICDEIKKRLTTDPLNSLSSLNEIDKKSRVRAFRNCFSPEVSDSTKLMKAIKPYSNKYPELIKEISGNTR